ncbi:putative F-box protein At1g49610 isoform X1 [Salvia miltiorrhiza]|uniref:putative F-box protein At1g49610 isoform X1 n=1 Tax=Salvia miltiorrhiza TaxID=226208 RepID=UPI0025AD3C60|nr:putative F-box protein At1g49610 isoform X1 [Salvia miltiorrhiza]XP_057771463.1 putative F-box protein At1g49610 isoform X1 [Salvia miltiorrhiza]XP_057771464.1 putative F-box protein At1g49610 isoform X1 [Salvia miltiorrhiza]
MDRLSELPDSLIFHIFWSLPMTDVVRTTILSKRWKNLWTTALCLNFDNDAMNFDDDRELQNFVNRALLRWNGVRLLKFKFNLGYKVKSVYQNDGSMYLGTDLWVQFATNKEVEEFYLHIRLPKDWDDDFDSMDDIYYVPQCVYSCSSLKVLSFEDCNFRVYGNVQWNQLKSLTITYGFGVTEHLINQILCGSPRLEVLIMSFVDVGEHLCIRSTSLKVLSIHKFFCSREDLWWDSELRICTPNLETLEIGGVPYRKSMLVNISSLTNATLGFSGLHGYEFDGNESVFPWMDTKLGLFTKDDFLGDVFCQFLSTMQHVVNVKLMFCCIKVLGAMIKRCMNSSYPNVKSLELRYCFSDYKLLVGLLESFPQLKKLVIVCSGGYGTHENRESLNFDAKSYLKFEAYPPKSFLQLRTVVVTWDEDDDVFPFLEYLLKYAINLEKMVVNVKGIMPPQLPSKSLFLASQKLLRMPRSSPTAQLVFCEY